MTWRVLAALAAGSGLACAHTQPPPPDASEGVESRWESTVDFAALRARYGERSDFDEVCSFDRPLRSVIREIEERDWPTALQLSESWLASCPVDMDAHYLAAVALTELGRSHEARAHIAWYKGLVESVLATGDGHSPETAWVVISPQEEYSILQALQVKLVQQRLLDGHIDAMTVEADAGTRTLYFNPEPHFRRLLLENPSGSE